MTGARAAVSVHLAPSAAEIDTIGACPQAALRNLRITHAYHRLALAVADTLPDAANWCTFATWASRQAGQTIRGDDLGRKLEHVFRESDTVQLVIGRLRDVRRALARQVETAAVLRAVREACAPLRVAARVADAVARGNKKVFDEIGLEFARFLGDVPAGAEPAALETFCRHLRDGDPPDGQRLLAAAFRGYHRARSDRDSKVRAERLLLANLRIGMHEQTRLQPEIAEALNACVPDAAVVRTALRDVIQPGSTARPRALRPRVGHTLVDAACDLVADRIRGRVREVITAELMTLALPGGSLRLGHDVTGVFPDVLRTIEDAELRAFVATVDASPDTTVGSGTRDWADLSDRMHFIADLFRTRHADPSLLQPPFTDVQLQAMAAGAVPDGDL